MGTIRAGDRETHTLQPGKVLNVTADSVSSGVVYRYPASGGDPYKGSTPTPPGATTQIGPFFAAQRMQVECSRGVLSIEVADQPSVVDDAIDDAVPLVFRDGLSLQQASALSRSPVAMAVASGWSKLTSATDNAPIGQAIRVDAAFTGPNVARLFVERTGEDTFYLVFTGATGAIDPAFSDCAIRGNGYKVLTSDTHADVWQTRTYPGDYSIKRCVVENLLPNRVISNGSGTSPVGSTWQWGPSSGTDANSADTGGTIQDVIIATNTNAINGSAQSGQNRTRCLIYVERDAGNSNVSPCNENAEQTYTDTCVVYANPATASDTTFSGSAPTKTRVVELRG